MYNTNSAIYGLKFQSRSIVAQLADPDHHRFFVGTTNVREPNEIHLIEFNEDANEIQCKAIYNHPWEVWTLACSPAHKNLLATSYTDGLDFKASLFRLRDHDAESKEAAPRRAARNPQQQLETEMDAILEFPGHRTRVKSLVWCAEDPSTMVTLDEDTMRVWKLDEPCSALQGNVSTMNNLTRLEAGCFDPHHPGLFVSVNDKAIRAWDFRTSRESLVVPDAHTQQLRDVDYNPNKPYHIVTGGHDRRIKFWDLRKPKLPLKILTGHTHWVWSVKYNRFHDQLVLSSGSDGQVNLWSVLSISSAPLGDLEDHSSDKDGDKLIKTFDEHEESVYSAAWSASDAWIFASLSYDGRVVVNHVPPPEKYKILL